MYSVKQHLSTRLARRLVGVLLVALLAPLVHAQQILFDDFSYSNTAQLSGNGWRIRTWNGGPGLANGTWSTANVSFVNDPASSGNKLMRLKASTNVNRNNINTATNQSTAGTSSQTEVARVEQVYKNGTWAARMFFTDTPSTGPDGDTVIETFFGLTDYIEGAEPYSEIDFEYLANGGWWTGSGTPAMWMSTYRIVDFSDPTSRGHTVRTGSLAGWRTLVAQVMDGYVSFYIDGVFQEGFSGAVAPDHPMYLMFQIWFSNDCFDPACNTRGYLNTSNYREYYEDIDWVYFEKDNIVSPTLVNQAVANLRAAGTTYVQSLDGTGSSSSSSSSPAFSQLIQAESYSYMSGVQTEATQDVGGGLNVGWIDAGDWMSYANVNFPTAGSYRVEFRVASPSGAQLSLDLNGGATQLGTVTIPSTGGWQSWTTVYRDVQLPAGTHSVGLYAPQSGWNINWLRITKL